MKTLGLVIYATGFSLTAIGGVLIDVGPRSQDPDTGFLNFTNYEIADSFTFERAATLTAAQIGIAFGEPLRAHYTFYRAPAMWSPLDEADIVSSGTVPLVRNGSSAAFEFEEPIHFTPGEYYMSIVNPDSDRLSFLLIALNASEPSLYRGYTHGFPPDYEPLINWFSGGHTRMSYQLFGVEQASIPEPSTRTLAVGSLVLALLSRCPFIRTRTGRLADRQHPV